MKTGRLGQNMATENKSRKQKDKLETVTKVKEGKNGQYCQNRDVNQNEDEYEILAISLYH